MDDTFAQLANLIGSIFGALEESDSLAGAIFGLIGFLVQLAVRGEWPTGRLNEGAPKATVDPKALTMAVFAAIAIGLGAAYLFELDVSKIKDSCKSAATKSCLQALKDPLFLVALGYLAADLGPPFFKAVAGLFTKVASMLKGPAK